MQEVTSASLLTTAATSSTTPSTYCVSTYETINSFLTTHSSKCGGVYDMCGGGFFYWVKPSPDSPLLAYTESPVPLLLKTSGFSFNVLL